MLGGEYIVELGQFNARRGMYKLASHALAGLVSRFAQPDAIAAISADTSSLSRILQEGSIQPLISLAYSKSPDDRKNACNAMANLCLQEEYQAKVVYEGGVRRMNQLVCKEAQSNDIKFFVALALARLAKNPDLRVPLLDSSVNADPRVNTHMALMCLSDPPPSNPSRAQRQVRISLSPPLSHLFSSSPYLPASLLDCLPPCLPACLLPSFPLALGRARHDAYEKQRQSTQVDCVQAVDALSFLCQEDSLHKMLVEGNVLPALIRQSNMDQPQDFRRNALQAMICICSACMSNPPAGDLSLQTVNNALNSLFESAQAAQAVFY
jgi:hypothetical protein